MIAWTGPRPVGIAAWLPVRDRVGVVENLADGLS